MKKVTWMTYILTYLNIYICYERQEPTSFSSGREGRLASVLCEFLLFRWSFFFYLFQYSYQLCFQFPVDGHRQGTTASVLSQQQWISQYGVLPLWYNMHAVCSETLSLYSEVVVCKVRWDVPITSSGKEENISPLFGFKKEQIIFKVIVGNVLIVLHSF